MICGVCHTNRQSRVDMVNVNDKNIQQAEANKLILQNSM